jgi:hypothetical protein
MLLVEICPPPDAMAQSEGLCADHDKPAILYTGKTYGYLRDNDKSQDSVANAFITTYDNIKQDCPQAILVGTGDNFAPDYGSRYYRDTQHKIKPVPRRGPNQALMSHAVQFFKNPHYDALVPGQLDFYFGADFLQDAGSPGDLPMLGANLIIKSAKPETLLQPLCGQPQFLLPTQVSLPLQSGSGSSGGGKGKGKKGGGGSGQGSSGSSSGQSGSGQSGQSCLQTPSLGGGGSQDDLILITPSPDSVYPWSTEFEFSLPTAFSLDKVSLCWRKQPNSSDFATKQGPPVFAGYDNCTDLVTGGPLPPAANSVASRTIYQYDATKTNLAISNTVSPATVLHFTQPPQSGQEVRLFPGADLGLCVEQLQQQTKANRVCVPLNVQRPFFDNIWVEVPKSNDLKYAIFGVLDPQIQGLISPENFSWGDDHQYKWQINIPDPAPALEQLVIAFQKLHPTDAKSWTYVLLAQMQRGPAQALGATLRWHQEHQEQLPQDSKTSHEYRFDVIFSAADYDEATPDISLTIDQDHAPTPVITPHPIVNESMMRNPLELLQVDRSDFRRTKYTNYTDRNPDDATRSKHFASPSSFEMACGHKMSDTIVKVLDAASKADLVPPNKNGYCNSTSQFQCLTLKTMADALHADAAMLQRRDFYDQCNYEGPSSGPPSAEMVQRVLWNSGYLTRASVSGTTLKAILQASDNIAKAEQSSTTEPPARNRDLVYLGITKSNGLYYVDGAALEETKIYSIATSDQVALGDNAYPQFSQVDLVSPTVFTGPQKHTFNIAQLASVALVGSPLDELSRTDVVAKRSPPPPPASEPKGAKPSSVPFHKAGSVEDAAQHRNFLTMTLQQASVGYTNSKPNQTDANINSNLAGVTNPNVASPHSDSLSYSDSFRLLYEWTPLWNLGLDQILTFARTRTGSLTASSQKTTTGEPVPPESINLSANTLIVSPFIEFQVRRSQPHWKAVARPVTFSTGLSRTLQFLPTKAPPNTPPNTPQVVYELNLKRQENWQPSIGLRYEMDNLNFFESGYLDQSARNVLAALTVNGGVPTPLTSGTTVSQITNVVPNPNDMAIPTYKTFRQQGAYWLGMYTKQLSGNTKVVKVTYQGLTYGNFLAYGAVDRTSTILTRYAAELSNNLQVQLWGNISFGPSYNIFWFQDQSHKAGNSLTRRDWNLQLNYSFDWHQGLEWKDVLEGKTQ